MEKPSNPLMPMFVSLKLSCTPAQEAIFGMLALLKTKGLFDDDDIDNVCDIMLSQVPDVDGISPQVAADDREIIQRRRRTLTGRGE